MHASPRLLLDSLKQCPLCEAVNAESSTTCFVCGWGGRFDRNAEDLQASFAALVAQCPDLTPERRPKPLTKGSWWDKLRRLFVCRR